MATLIDVASRQENFTCLLAAIRTAGMDVTLAGKNAFTLFAPTDEAFEKLPKGALEMLFDDPPTLMEVLTFHLVPGVFPANEMIRHAELNTIYGQPLRIDAVDRVKINEAEVVQVNLQAQNGVIHAIDRVLLPHSHRVRSFCSRIKRELVEA